MDIIDTDNYIGNMMKINSFHSRIKIKKEKGDYVKMCNMRMERMYKVI